MMDPRRPRVAIRVPDLGLGEIPLTLCLWLVPVGSVVSAGERVAELLAGTALVEMPASSSGTLVEKLVHEDERVSPGQVLAWLEKHPCH